MEARTGGNLDFVLRNNWPQIVTYQIEASGAGLEFMQAKTELAVGAIDERRFSLRVFPGGALEGLQEWKLRVSAPERGTLELPVRLVLVPRGKTVAWSADLDGDGTPEWVLESHRARAVFSTEDGGRWREFTWKDTGANFLPEQGAFAGTGHVEVRAEGNTLIFTGQGWRRTVRLDAATLDIDQTGPLVPDGLNPEKRSNVSFSISRPSPTHSTYALQQ
jgi:hypothetical protein